MKKFILFALAATILAGCSNNYLDEKIKCKNLADKRIEEVQNDLDKDIDFKNAKLTSTSRYALKEDTCFLKINIFTNSNTYNSMENLLTGEKFSYDEKSFAISNCATETNENCENILPKKQKYDDLVEKYFSENAE
ncbi:membrane lipoprotein lipid attachment site-containing protein [Candidatus Gracilibacteria bacterium]|nr:membrane lipoprotein lipid attachment site-containing protein [Candidatus Gracilibacteria bacterium]MCF7856030.1 membrane lipoprotein lipid attachment site-containing protein [Candidatus Gracilibacteria bacterium]MCF7896415.1 membrane lipoprotein lipid attachment site-containing protein [Candidatus Gracilibacteria bacterium]